MEKLSPWKKTNNIPLIFACNDSFFPYVMVMIESVLQHSSKDYFYDVIILYSDIQNDSMKRVNEYAERFSNLNIRFYDVSGLIENRSFYTAIKGNRLSKETYYRMFIPDVLDESYKKVIYLDGDMICLQNIADLYNIPLGNNYIAAVRDISGIAYCYRQDGSGLEKKEYRLNTIKIKSIDDYFIAGLIVFDLPAFRKKISVDKLLETTFSREWQQHDQDVLNYLCRSKVLFLPEKWNVLQDFGSNYNLPESLKNKWMESAEDPAIVHYGGDQKPWKNDMIWQEHFWKTAADTPFFTDVVENDVFANQYYDENEKKAVHEDLIRIQERIRTSKMKPSRSAVLIELAHAKSKRSAVEHSDSPLISVIVPIYNSGRYLKRCLNSITGQTYRNLEIILVDDGSTDNSGKICDQYAAKDHRIKVIHKENGGVSSARNAGLKSATGEYIGWVDSDDWITLDMYEYLLYSAKKYKTSITMCSRLNVSNKKKKAGSHAADDILSAGAAFELMLKNTISTSLCDKLFERELFNGIVFPEGAVFEGEKIVFGILEKSQWLGIVHKTGYYRSVHSDSITQIPSVKNKMDRISAVVKRGKELRDHFPRLRPLLLKTVYEAGDEAMYMLAELPKNEWEPNKQTVSEMAEFLKENREYSDHPDAAGVIDKHEYDLLAQGNKKAMQEGAAYNRKKLKEKASKEKKERFKAKIKNIFSKAFLKNTLVSVFYKIDPTYRAVVRLEAEVEKLRKIRPTVKVPADTRAENIYWLSNSKAGETIQETKQRVFMEMPKWGGQIGEIQDGNNKLLKAFKRICGENGLNYWILGGTLLGAVRHKGFIPWDDDIDVGMMRDEMEKLFEAMERYPDYDLRWYYHSKGPWRTAKLTFNDESPFWIDILCYDYAGNPDYTEEKLWEEITLQRKNAVKTLTADAEMLKLNYRDEPPFDHIDEKRLTNAYKKWIPLLPYTAERKYVYRSLDNVCAASQRLFPIEKTMPFIELEFEGEMYSAPCDYEYWLTAKFGDYYTLPGDIGHIHTRFLESGKRTII